MSYSTPNASRSSFPAISEVTTSQISWTRPAFTSTESRRGGFGTWMQLHNLEETKCCERYCNINTGNATSQNIFQYQHPTILSTCAQHMCTTHVPSLPVVLRCKSCWQTMQTTPTSPHHFELAQLHGMFLLADSHPATPFRRFDVLVCLILQLDTLSRYISRYLDMQQHLQQQRLQIPRTSKPNYPTLSWNSLRPCVRTYRSH